MRGTVAKRIRKQVYGDMSQKGTREYEFYGRQRLNTGLRRVYRTAKKLFMEDKKNA
jgi:heterodisulfide reductase subunit A-like polyferredoxin